MINNLSVLAIIPARKGSKRLQKKNMLKLKGRPLIYHTLNASNKSKYIDNTVISTDANDIKTYFQNYKKTTFIDRPKYLSGDNAKTIDVMFHCIKKLKLEKKIFDIVVLLQPTSPLRTAFHIDKALEMLVKKKAYSIISVCKNQHPIQWSGTLSKDLSLDNFFKSKDFNKSNKELISTYRLNGAIYIYKSDRLEQTKSLFDRKKSFAFIMDEYESIDIDTKEDFEFTKFIMKDH